MPERSNPLAGLVVDPAATTAERLAGILQGRVHIDPASNSVFIDDETATARQRVLLALLGRQALAMFERDESITSPAPPKALAPRDIEEITGLPGGTVRPVLQELLSKRLVQRNGGYSVLHTALTRIADIVAGAEEA